MPNKGNDNGKGKPGNNGGGRGGRKRKTGANSGPNELAGVSYESDEQFFTKTVLLGQFLLGQFY